MTERNARLPDVLRGDLQPAPLWLGGAAMHGMIPLEQSGIATPDGWVGISVGRLIEILDHDGADPDAYVWAQLPSQEVETIFEFVGGRVRIDTGSHKLSVDGEMPHAPPKVFDLLAFLARRRDLVQPCEVIGREVWDASKDRTATVRTHIKLARRLLGPYRAMIRTSEAQNGGYVLEDILVDEV